MTAPAPVDVLSLVNKILGEQYPDDPVTAIKAQRVILAIIETLDRERSAAVAELIEAAKELDATYGWVWDRDDGAIFIMPHRVTEFDRRSARLSAALARCRGAQ